MYWGMVLCFVISFLFYFILFFTQATIYSSCTYVFFLKKGEKKKEENKNKHFSIPTGKWVLEKYI